MDLSRDRLGCLLFQQPRILKYRALSTCHNVVGSPVTSQPLLLRGLGTIRFGHDVVFGWRNSDGFYTGYGQLEASAPEASIVIGDGAEINNNVLIKSEGPGICIGANALLGSRICIYDSDFHELDPRRRAGGRPRMAAVELQDNVFIGDRVVILKGVTVGADSVIGAGSVVTSSIPPGVIAAGNPARILRELRSPRELRLAAEDQQLDLRSSLRRAL
jgi:acetyltransferase-like isoleucine patch superfamily enzyme